MWLVRTGDEGHFQVAKDLPLVQRFLQHEPPTLSRTIVNKKLIEIIQACLITPTIQQVTASHCKSTSRSFGSTWFPPATALCRAGFRDRPLSPTSVPPRAPSVAWRRGVLRSGRQTTDDSTAHGIDFRCLKKGAREPSKDLISEVISCNHMQPHMWILNSFKRSIGIHISISSLLTSNLS